MVLYAINLAALFLAPLLVPLAGRVSWWWAARQVHRPVAERERRLRRELARNAVLWVHTGDLGLPPAHVADVARSCGFAVAWAVGAPDGHAMLLSRDSPGGLREMAQREAYRGGYPAGGVLTSMAVGLVLAAVLIVPVLLGPTDDDTFLAAFFGGVAALFFTAALLFFGRFYGGRSRRIGRVLGEFRAPRSVFVTLPAVGLDPHLVRALGEEMGFVFQGYDHLSRPLLRSMAFTPA
ncbi:MAG: hypothetical protein ACRDTC_28845 [Pseudonocardiaceae bacterium]